MNFLHPEILYLLPLVIVLFGFLLTQKEAQAHFFSQEVMEKLRVSANTLTLKARNALYFLIAVLMLIALSGPVINEGTVLVKAKSADIMIALDISDSMLAEDVYPNRLKSAKQKAIELLSLAPTERIGIIAFAQNSYLVSPLSFDHGAVSFLLSQLSTDSITEKGTDFLSMLNAVDGSGTEKGKKYLLILSDGGDKSDFSEEIEFAKEKNIVVFVLGIGTRKGAPIKLNNGRFIKQNGDIIISKLNQNIVNFATKTGGVYIENVNSDQDINTMLSEIEQNSYEKELKSEEVKKFIPLFYYPLGLALLILLIATSSMSKRERYHLPSLLLVALFAFTPNAEAGLLDFMELNAAKEAYESGEYEKSAEIYQSYAESANRAETHFNVGNSLYKQEKYKEAIESYEKALFDESSQRADNYANLGNAHVKSKEKQSLQKALEAYTKSLEINEDADTRQNYEAVKKAIEEQKKKEKEKEKEKEQDKQDSKEQNKDKQEDSDKKKDDKNQDSKNNQDSKKKGSSSDSKDSKDKNTQDKNSDKENQKNDKSKNDNKKGEKPQDKKDDFKKSQDLNKTKAEQEKQGLKELDSQENKSKPQSSADAKASSAQEEMSDAEETKWLEQLNTQQNTYMYMLSNPKPKEANSNEKPW